MKWESEILSPPSSSSYMSNSYSSWMVEDSLKSTIWTPIENKLFENALAKFDKDTPDRLFLLGLKKYGTGDWRNISRNFVVTRTPTQVASHAQKYFIRQISGGKDKRRARIHDITTNHVNENIFPLSEYKTINAPEQRMFQLNQLNSESTTMDFNQTNVNFCICGDDNGADGGLYDTYIAPQSNVFQMQNNTYNHQ